MNTDFRVNVNFFDHPKTVKLERRLGFQGVKALLRLWSWAAINRPDGALGGDIEDIEIAAQWSGEPDLFVNTVVALRWLDLSDGHYSLHDWDEHNPWAADADTRSDEARLSRLFRTNADKAKEFKQQGRTGITHEEYQEFKTPTTKYDRSTTVDTTVVRPQYDRSTVRSTPDPAPDPAPTPFSFFPPAVESEPAPVASADDGPKKEKKMGGSVVEDWNPKPKPSGIPDHWQPSPTTLPLFAPLGIPDAFVHQQVSLFVLHHQEAGTTRNGYESLFVGWVKKAWQQRPEEPALGVRRRGQTIAERITEEASAFEAAEAAAGREDPFLIHRPKQEAANACH